MSASTSAFTAASASDTGTEPREQPRPDLEVQPDPLRPLKLLSLDGGGVRGLSSIIILENLMTMVNAARKKRGLRPKEPWQLFDLIGGTSTGGLIAIMLGRLRMSIADCKRWYLEIARDAFTPTASRYNPISRWFAGPSFDGDKLEDAIYRIILSSLPEGSKLHNDPQFNKKLKPKPEPRESLLQSPIGLEESCKVFVVSTKADNTTAVVFRSYNNLQKEPKFYETCRIWEACRATSAATTFFPPLEMQGETFLDGGLLHNNPVDLVYSEAMDLWPNTVPLLVSIGTGVAPDSAFQGSLLTIASRLKDIATETERTHLKFKEGSGREVVRSNRYFRFNVPGIGAIGLEEWRKLPELQYHTEKYIELNAATANACVQKLLEVISQAMKLRSEEMVDWISHIPVLLDHSIVKQKLEPCLTRSGDWLINDHLIPWTKSRNLAKPVFWLRGGIGMGKTSLMSQIIDWYMTSMQPEEQLAYFYCSRALDGRSDPVDIFRSLFAQLSCAKDHSVIIPRLQTEYEKRNRMRALSSRLSNEEVKNYFKEVVNANHSTITIVVDGLDECSNFNKLLRQLNLLFDEVTGTGTLRMVLSSRMQVNPPRNFPSQKEVVISPDRNAKDIKEFIHSQIFEREECHHGERLLNGDYQELELEQQLCKTLTNRAQGMFLWAELQLATFFPANQDLIYPKDVKRKLSVLESSTLRSNLPPLDQVYEEIYNMNAPPDTGNLLVAQRVYKWMLYARRNLRLEELLEAVSIGVDGISDPYIKVTETYIMRVCANFIICNDTGAGSKVAQFAHSSVKDYLESRPANEYSKGAANGQIAESCLSYLGQVDRKTIEHAYLDDGFPNYALAYWPLHLREACANTYPMPIMQLSGRFSEERFENWIKMLHPVAMNLRHDISTQEKLLDCISREPNRLFLGCAWDIHTLVKDQIGKGINLEECNTNNENALYIASKHGHSRIVDLLLKEGKVHVNASCGECLGALQVASKKGHISVVEILLEKGAKVKLYNGLALTLAAKEGHEKIVRLLVTNLRDQDEYKRDDLRGAENLNDALSRLSPPIDEALGSSIRSSSGAGSDLHHDYNFALDLFGADSIEDGFYKAVQGAAISGNHETVDILLENARNIGISTTDSKRCRDDALEPAALYGHKAVIGCLLKWRADPNWIGSKSKSTSVEIAAEAGHVAIVRLLLDGGADIKTVGSVALQRAAVAGHIEIVKLLLERDATFDLRQDACLSTLQDVAANGFSKIVGLLVERGQRSVSYRTVLNNAAKEGDEDIVNLLLTMETRSSEYHTGSTPPHPDFRFQDEAIKLLLEHDAKSKGSKPTVLQSATSAEHALIVGLLLDKGATVNTYSSQESPLQLAARSGRTDIVKLLLNKHADINALGPEGSALQLAAENGHDTAVRLLLENEALADASNDRGTALQLAAAAGHELIIVLLLDNGANVNVSVGGTALQRATLSKHEGVVEILVTRGADVNISNASNDTVLQTAAARGYKDIVRTLLNAGADLNTESGSYGSALQAAVVEGKVGMVDLLLEHGAKDLTAGGKKRWDAAASSWLETTQTPQLALNETNLLVDDTHPISSSIDHTSLLVQLAKENDNYKRREASQKQILLNPSYLQIQRSRSRTGSRGRQPSISQLQENYARNPLSLESMAERSPVSSPRPMSPRPTSPIMANRLQAADALSHSASPV